MLAITLLLVLPAMQASPSATPPPPLEVSVVTTEGGINPGGTALVLSADGSVRLEQSRLAGQKARTERWTIAPETVERARLALERCSFFAMPETLNRAHGSQAAFTIRIEARIGDRRHAVVGYTFGEPPLPEQFSALAEALRAALTADGRYPAPATPAP